jgi:hypothetical protein
MATQPSDGLGGRLGERWRNNTSLTWYQVLSSLRDPCPDCIERHGRISVRPWPLPFHMHCECEQLEIPPGQEAPIESRSPADLIARVDAAARPRLLGADVARLLEAGLVGYADVVAEGWRYATLEELARKKELTLEQLRRSGVAEGVARRAVGLGPMGK